MALSHAAIEVTLDYSLCTMSSPAVILESVKKTTTTDSNGQWSVDLVPNANITPTGTVYSVRTPLRSFQVTVPSSPAQASANIVNVPVLPGQSTTLTGPLTVQNGPITLQGDIAARSLTLSPSSPYNVSGPAGGIVANVFDNIYFLPPPSGDVTGVTDTAAIQAVLTTVRLAGGGTVIAQPGTYWLTLQFSHPNGATYSYAMIIGSKTALIGAGRDATTFKLAANQTRGNDLANTNCFLINWNIAAGGDEQITLQDFTVDGNAANQTHTHEGIHLMRTRGARHLRVRGMNFRGTATSGVNETFQMEVELSTDSSYTDCEAIGTAGSTASGFSANSTTATKYSGCVSFGLTIANGFAWNTCRIISAYNCHAYLCGNNGFSVESSDQFSFGGCVAGGVSSSAAGYPFGASASLGNTVYGFNLAGSSRGSLVDCISRKNANGVGILTLATGIRIDGGDYGDNGTYALIFGDATSAQGTVITGNPVVTGNGASMQVGGQNYNIVGVVPNLGGALNIPATTVALIHPFPVDATVYITAGAGSTCAVAINGTAVATIAASGIFAVRLCAGTNQTITLTYTSAPTWVWSLG